LDFDTLIYVAKLDISTYKAMLALPNVARHFRERQTDIQKHFTVILDGRYTLNDKSHRLDGPAVVSGEEQLYYQKGRKHRGDDKSAIIWANGSSEY
jgi:hypothetical protein